MLDGDLGESLRLELEGDIELRASDHGRREQVVGHHRSISNTIWTIRSVHQPNVNGTKLPR